MSALQSKQIHNPMHAYDCGSCKFNWCCGFVCSCPLTNKLPEPPGNVKLDVDAALIAIGYSPQFYGRGSQRR